MKKRIPRKLKKKIPEGFYCYRGLSFDWSTGIYKIKPCPFYKHIEGIEGRCSLLNCEIDDQVKNCGIKRGF